MGWRWMRWVLPVAACAGTTMGCAGGIRGLGANEPGMEVPPLARSIVANLATGNHAGIRALLAPDVRLIAPGEGEIVGREEVIARLRRIAGEGSLTLPADRFIHCGVQVGHTGTFTWTGPSGPVTGSYAAAWRGSGDGVLLTAIHLSSAAVPPEPLVSECTRAVEAAIAGQRTMLEFFFPTLSVESPAMGVRWHEALEARGWKRASRYLGYSDDVEGSYDVPEGLALRQRISPSWSLGIGGALGSERTLRYLQGRESFAIIGRLEQAEMLGYRQWGVFRVGGGLAVIRAAGRFVPRNAGGPDALPPGRDWASSTGLAPVLEAGATFFDIGPVHLGTRLRWGQTHLDMPGYPDESMAMRMRVGGFHFGVAIGAHF